MSLLLLFIVAFAAASVLPMSSEVLVLATLEHGQAPALVWLVATTGNTLGALVNYALGVYVMRFEQRPWFPCDSATLQRAQRGFHHFGRWSLLFSWLPLVGDGLTVIAGALRTPMPMFLLLVAIGKGARYASVILLYDGLRPLW